MKHKMVNILSFHFIVFVLFFSLNDLILVFLNLQALFSEQTVFAYEKRGRRQISKKSASRSIIDVIEDLEVQHIFLIMKMKKIMNTKYSIKFN